MERRNAVCQPYVVARIVIPPSPRRMPGSSFELIWIPAFAGMTGEVAARPGNGQLLMCGPVVTLNLIQDDVKRGGCSALSPVTVPEDESLCFADAFLKGFLHRIEQVADGDHGNAFLAFDDGQVAVIPCLHQFERVR